MDKKTIEVPEMMVEYPDIEHSNAWAPHKHSLVARILGAEAAGEDAADVLEAMLVKAFAEGLSEGSSPADP